MQQDQSIEQKPSQDRPQKPLVNERGSFNVSGYIRVFDPNNQETFVEARE
jgi:hypothetical protein